VKTRDRHDRVIVQEKLDGSNVAVAKVNGIVMPLTRAGYRAEDSPYAQHHRFAEWAYVRQDLFDGLLAEGERVCGEWLYQAHGTRYDLPHGPFVPFDLLTGPKRVPFDEFTRRVSPLLPLPFVAHDGGACSVEKALKALGEFGKHGGRDPVEGAVWRVERQGAVDYLCKFVRTDKVDGLYLPELNGGVAVNNSWPGKA
jgi:hypothetical protein